MTEGGAERVAALLSNFWVAQGHEVTLMPTFSGRGECFYPLDSRVRLDYLADRVQTVRKTPRSSVRRFIALRRAIKETRPDVVVSFLTHVNVVALLATIGLRVPVIVSERVYPSLQPIGGGWLFLCRLLYRRATLVVAQTDGIAEWIKRNCRAERVTVIPNPVVLPIEGRGVRLDPSRFLSHRRTVLSVGRLVEQKGYRRLMRAFADIANEFPDWDLVILGDGPERERLEACREELNVVRRVHLPGRAANVGDWYSCASLFVLSSFYEGFPNTLLEAMAYGVAVISIDCPTGPAEIIRDGVDGLLVSEDPGALPEAMRLVMRDDRMRERMAASAREATARFSLDRIGASWTHALNASP
jgi:glycosyltransferase involved in cell wall biosynthesis